MAKEIKNADTKTFTEIHDALKKGSTDIINHSLRVKDGTTIYTSDKLHNVFADSVKKEKRKVKLEDAAKLIIDSIIREHSARVNDVEEDGAESMATQAEKLLKELKLSQSSQLYQENLPGIKTALEDAITNYADRKSKTKRVKALWGKVRDRLPDIAKLAPRGKLIPVDKEDYGAEVLRPNHEPTMTGGTFDLKESVDDFFIKGTIEGFLKFMDVDVNGRPISAHLSDIKDQADGEFTEYKRLAIAFFRGCINNEALTGAMWTERVDALEKVVKYVTPDEQGDYTVDFVGGTLKKNGINFDTTEMRGSKDAGSAAFVITGDGRLMAEPHQIGEFHHSSFEAGGRVLCAGMIKVRNGKIVSITDNSGHYKPDVFNILEGIRKLQEIAGGDPFDGSATIKVLKEPAPMAVQAFIDKYGPLSEAHWEEVFEERDRYYDKIGATGFLDKLQRLL